MCFSSDEMIQEAAVEFDAVLLEQLDREIAKDGPTAEQSRRSAQEAWEEFKRHYMPVELTPSHHGKDCLGNGEHEVECQCDECDHYLECFPDWEAREQP